MRMIRFNYKGANDRTPEVIVTFNNTSDYYGFNTKGLQRKHIEEISAATRRFANQPWPVEARNRYILAEVSKRSQKAFRHYHRKNMKNIKEMELEA